MKIKRYIFIIVLVLGVGCEKTKLIEPQKIQLPLPTKDDLIKIENLSFSLNHYFHLREKTGLKKKKELVSIGTLQLALMHQFMGKLSSFEALEIVLIAYGHRPFDTQKEKIIALFSDPKPANKDQLLKTLNQTLKNLRVLRNQSAIRALPDFN